jgi:hypothetical protein
MAVLSRSCYESCEQVSVPTLAKSSSYDLFRQRNTTATGLVQTPRISNWTGSQRQLTRLGAFARNFINVEGVYKVKNSIGQSDTGRES